MGDLKDSHSRIKHIDDRAGTFVSKGTEKRMLGMYRVRLELEFYSWSYHTANDNSIVETKSADSFTEDCIISY